jgi:putative ABC transport system permease protein
MRGIYGSSGQLGSRNIQRARLRSSLTVAALMIGVAMIIVVWAMTGSFKYDLDEWLRGYIAGDLYVTSSLPIRRDVWNRLESVEGVAAVAPIRYFEAEWQPPGSDKEKIVMMAFDPASYSRVTSFVFSKDRVVNPRLALNQMALGDSVFVSSVLSEKYGLKPGDTINVMTRTGAHPFTIAAVVVDFFNQGLVIHTSWRDMTLYFRQRDANALFLKVEDGYSTEEIKQRIENLYRKKDNLVVASNRSLLERVSRLTRQAFSIFDVLAIIALLVAFLGISNTMTMNVMERTQEIGMLRSVGMTQGQIVQMILAEAGVMGLIGGSLGVIFGTILARVLMLAMTAMSGYNLTYVLPVERILVAVGLAVLVSNLAALLPALRSARVRILDAIQYE